MEDGTVNWRRRKLCSQLLLRRMPTLTVGIETFIVSAPARSARYSTFAAISNENQLSLEQRKNEVSISIVFAPLNLCKI